MSKAPIEHLVACWQESQPDPAILGKRGGAKISPAARSLWNWEIFN